MIYDNLCEAEFIERLNRFVAAVKFNGQKVMCHVRNTGRLKELLVPGVKVYIEESGNPARKYRYTLVQVQKGEQIVNIDSQAPNKMAAQWAADSGYFGEKPVVRPERTFGSSRFDLYIECGKRRIFMEVKGVTLERDGIAYFPDAPTERGIKHLNELAECVSAGYEAYILFVIQMKGISEFRPNDTAHPEFGAALRHAAEAGVKVLAYDCELRGKEVCIDMPVPVQL